MLWVSLQRESKSSCVINNEVVLAVAARGRTWLIIQGTVALRCQSEGCFEPRVYIPVYLSMIVSTVCLFKSIISKFV